ncbi:hypothetical protein OAS73_01940 [Luminiphilus sp.]|nr:hypothetical protein [Luminiphilus sp.]
MSRVRAICSTIATYWIGDFRSLSIDGWEWVDTYADKSLGDPIGNGGGDFDDYSVCFSLSPFTTTNTNNGETCTHEGPFTVAADTSYYRMMIDRSQTPTRYCQIEKKTASASPAKGDTRVVALNANGGSCVNVPDPDGNGDDVGGGGGGSNQATAVPTMPIYLLMALSGLLALFGFFRASK